MNPEDATIITKYTYEDLQKLFYIYEQSCKSHADVKLMKELFRMVVNFLHIEKGVTYSSVPHKE